ncbi:MAG: DNA-binding protein [bacterium]|nr:DNA-binding protein [bacterium]
MTIIKEVKAKNIYMGKLSHDSDLLEEITKICYENNITLGRVEALGAVKKARLGFYDQNKREYAFSEINKPLEITKLIGNISTKDAKPIIHAHITLSDETDKAFGGHLTPGTIVFACEFIIQSFDGPEFSRGFDEETGLPLWDFN